MKELKKKFMCSSGLHFREEKAFIFCCVGARGLGFKGLEERRTKNEKKG